MIAAIRCAGIIRSLSHTPVPLCAIKRLSQIRNGAINDVGQGFFSFNAPYWVDLPILGHRIEFIFALRAIKLFGSET